MGFPKGASIPFGQGRVSIPAREVVLVNACRDLFHALTSNCELLNESPVCPSMGGWGFFSIRVQNPVFYKR